MSEEIMSPDYSPTGITGIKRLTRVPIYVMGFIAMIITIVVVMVVTERSLRQEEPADKKTEIVYGSQSLAAEIIGDQNEGQIASAPELPKEDDLNDSPPLPPVTVLRPSSDNSIPPLPPRSDDLDRIRIIKLQQLHDAVKAKTDIPVSINKASPSKRDETLAKIAEIKQRSALETQTNPTNAYMAKLQQMRAGGTGTASMGLSSLTGSLSNVQRNSTSQFDNAGQGDRWALNSKPEAPRSPYELRAGFVIPAIMISGINSELPGQIHAQVSQDVFDTPTGKWKLIPQGSRLVGRYSSDIIYGQSRVLVVWQRIIFPDGKAMDIGAMPGSDSGGYAGFSDQVNNHYVRLFASAILMSGITAGITYSQRQGDNDTTSAGSALSEALGQQLGQATAQLIAKNMNIAPTLEIRPGYRFHVTVVKDLTFDKPYQPFDYKFGD